MRIAYIKSGDVVVALERLSLNAANQQVDDGGPDGFLGDLLRSLPNSNILLIGLALSVLQDRADASLGRIRALTLLAKSKLHKWRSAFRVFSEIVAFRPDCIICGKCGASLWSSYIASRILRVPFLHSRHNWHEQYSLKDRISTLIDNWVAQRADAVICHGPYLRDRLVEIGVPVAKIIEFDSGNSSFVAEVEKLGRSESGLGMAEDKVVLFVGRIVQHKGVFDLLDACQPLFQRVQKIRLVYAGIGPDLEKLKSTVAERGLMDRIDFLGRVSHLELGRIMQSSHFVVTPTRSTFPEGRCMVVMEALAVGTPVVAPDFGPFPYLVEHQVNGLLFSPDLIEDLQEKLLIGLEDDLLYRNISAGAKSSGEKLIQPKVTYSKAVGQALSLARS